ncbi:MAG: dipeptidase [Phototrophicaceae bacterium]
MTTSLEYAQTNATRFEDELIDLLKIQSVSTDAAFSGQIREAADWLIEEFKKIGLSTDLIEIEGHHPIVYAEWMGAGSEAKTVLIYGHYDVQPAVMEDGWETDPFEPVRKDDGFLYARGATDDKGQFYTHVKAVEALLKTDDLPVNVKFIIEGEEEAGGEAIAQYVQNNPEKLAADVCVISDTSMQDIENPVIINALRGGITFEVTVIGPRQDLHSGMFGGTIHNPAQALAEIITKLHKDDGSVAVSGFYDDVLELTEAEREEIAQVSWDNVDWSEATGATVPWGEEDYSLLERIGARPTLEITGMASGYYGDGSKSIVPHKAIAKISCRLVANQNPQDIEKKVIKFIEKIAPPTIQIKVKSLRAGALPALIKTDTPAMQAAIAAYEKGWGAKPIFKREGGSIPIVSDFQSVLNLPVIMMGFGLNSDNLHGPNERFNLEMFHKGIATSIYFLREVAALPNTHSESDQS